MSTTDTQSAPLETWLQSLAEGLVSSTAPVQHLDFELKLGVSAVRDAGLTQRYGRRGGPGEGLHLVFSPGVESAGATAILRGTLTAEPTADVVIEAEVSAVGAGGWSRIAVRVMDRFGVPLENLPVELNLDWAQTENLRAPTWSAAGPKDGSWVSPGLARTDAEGRTFARLVVGDRLAPDKAARAVIVIDAAGRTTRAAVPIA